MLTAEDFEGKSITVQERIPAVQTLAALPAQSQDYGDFLVKYVQNIHGPIDVISDASFQIINESFGVAYVPLDQVGELQINSYSYNSIPKCYTYMDMEALDASGVMRLQDHPYLQLRGRGTAVAVIDSGIDYTNSVFRDENGKTRIAYLWDQTIEERADERVPYGSFLLRRILTGHWNRRLLLKLYLLKMKTGMEQGLQVLRREIRCWRKISQVQRRKPLFLL